MKALILYSSRDGQTHAIASYIASKLQEAMCCDVVDLLQAESIDLGQYQRIMIGASIRYGHFHPALDKFCKTPCRTFEPYVERFLLRQSDGAQAGQTFAAN
ncbi:Protoporphyrinogen IX dehydrogenase [menaquinone] [Serratia rubidaea]|uniref:Protoporphyrinogen IX dehydrogenase [menaquinone] n=1 Tax=Serratia rubidaea TaxID=61652 RepID=A0A4U9HAU0_SERRU|nr:Protoporphyrinogen IX dehydrogenase [menaquinone] [Serratia rubidaea]